MKHAKALAVLLLNLPLWTAYTVLVAVLWLIGVPLIWWAARKPLVTYMASKIWPERVIWSWTLHWMRPVWGNEQDGVTGNPVNHPSSLAGWSERQFSGWADRIFQWSAIRNSTNNLRFIHHFYPWLGWLNPRTIEPARIRSVGVAWPLSAVLEKWTSPHMEDCGEEMVLVSAGGYKRRFAYSLVWQFPYAGLKVAFRIGDRSHQFWFGWKLNAGMADPHWWPEDPCWKGVGFTAGQRRSA